MCAYIKDYKCKSTYVVEGNQKCFAYDYTIDNRVHMILGLSLFKRLQSSPKCFGGHRAIKLRSLFAFDYQKM